MGSNFERLVVTKSSEGQRSFSRDDFAIPDGCPASEASRPSVSPAAQPSTGMTFGQVSINLDASNPNTSNAPPPKGGSPGSDRPQSKTAIRNWWITANKHKYFAFISYSRKDSRAVRWLQREMENYRYPIKQIEASWRPPHTERLRPIARDKFTLNPNAESFWDDIKAKIDESRYLLVVCSPRAAGSPYVNREVEHFLASRPDALLYVVPVILEGSPNIRWPGMEKLECFCPALRSISDELLKRTLPTMIPDEGAPELEGWQNGFVQMTSYMLHADREIIANAYQPSSKPPSGNRTVLTVSLTLAAVFILLMAFGLYSDEDVDVGRGNPIRTSDGSPPITGSAAAPPGVPGVVETVGGLPW